MISKLLGFLFATALVAFTQPAFADDIHVVVSGGLATAYNRLVPEFEKQSGHHVISAYGSSMGTTETGIPTRLDRGDPIDLLLMVRDGLPLLQQKKQIAAGSEIDLAKSYMAMAVKEGAPVPDIRTLDAFKRTLLAAKSVAYSDSASGHYIHDEMYKKLGIDAQMAPKSTMIPATPVGEILVAGKAEIGFQQYSELAAVKGVHIVGLVPEGAQKVTLYTAVIPSAAKASVAAKALIAFLQSPHAQAVIKETGLDPIAPKK